MLNENNISAAHNLSKPWKVLIVDDEPEIHHVTRMVLRDFVLEGRGIEFLEAFRADEVAPILKENPDTAAILLDVVMESDYSGLNLVKTIRNEMQNHLVRIILRTGQPGQAPEATVVKDYDINDYKAKTELTSQKLITTITSVLRAFNNLQTIFRQNQELLKLNYFKNEFIGRLSGELTPAVTDICTMIETAMEENISDSSRKEVLTQADNQGKKLKNTLGKVFNFFELDEKVNELFSEDVDIRNVIEFVLSNHSQEVKERNIKVMLELDALPKNYQANRLIMEIIFDELLTNAIYYNRKEGSLNVKVFREGLYLKIDIEDTGVGIKEEDLEHIFCQFFRTPDSENMFQCGAGLGLFMARKSSRYYGGDVTVRSSYAQGSCFTVSLLLHGE